MKIVVGLISCVLLLAAQHPCRAENPIRIGVSTALTGNAATYGIDLKNTLIFANEKIAGNRYQLVFEDDKCNGRDAVSVAQRFTSILKLKHVIGFPCSGAALSTAKNYEQSGVLAMLTGASAAEISQAGDFIFRTWPSDALAAKKLYEHIAVKHKNFGVLSEQTDYPQSFLKSFAENNRGNEITVANENFLTETLDFRSVLLRLKNRKIDGLFINSQTEATLLAALKQVKEMGLDVPIYSAYLAGTNTFLEKASEMAEGITYVDLPAVSETASPDGIKLFAEFEQRFGKMNSIELMFATTFEGFRALHLAIQSGEDLRAYLYGAKFQGIIGDWSFDRNGDIQGLGFVLKVVRGGERVGV